MIHLFCPQCGTYLGRSDRCEACGYRRSPVERPVPPGQVFWRVKVPGEVGKHLTLTMLGDRPVLLVPWSERPQYRPATGGVVALDARTGEEVWSREVGAPVEAGVALAMNRVFVPVRDTPGSGRVVVLDLTSGDILQEIGVPAAVVNTPVAVERRVYFATDDGALYAVDALTGEVLPGFPRRVSERPVPVRASPVLVSSGREDLLIVGTYGRDFDRVPGRVVAVTVTGRIQWQRPAYGNVRATPVIVGRTLYVTAYRDRPSTGYLFALDVVNGRPLWDAPFQVGGEAASRRKHYLSASPRVVGDVVYVTSVDRHLYAVDARTGRLLWDLELPRSIATQPLWAHGLLLIAANDARVHAVDTEGRHHLADAPIVEEDLSLSTESDSTQPWGRRRPRINALTQPLLWGDVLFAAATDGTVVALPWHLGQYAWVAEHFLQERKFLAAGDHFALAAHTASTRAERERYWQRAVDAWQRAEHYDRIGALYQAQGKYEDAAAAFVKAARFYRHREHTRALAAAQKALRLYQHRRVPERILEAMRLMCDIARLPFVKVEKFNAARYRLWEEGLLELKVSNEGVTEAVNLRLRLGGSLKQSVELSFEEGLPANKTWIVPLRIVPTREESLLEVEVIYSDAEGRLEVLTIPWTIPLEAERPPTPPPEIKFGDVGHMQVVIESLTREGIRIHTRDVGMIRGEQVRNVKVGGDVGAISSRGGMGDVAVGGDVGIISNRGRMGDVTVGGDVGAISNRGGMGDVAVGGDVGIISNRGGTGGVNMQGNVGGMWEELSSPSRMCSKGHENPPDARYCQICGEKLTG